MTPFELAPGVSIGGDTLPFIAGPCVSEGEEETLDAARKVASMAHRLGLPLLFKASFDKANRSSLKSYRGPGMVEGLRILAKAKEETGLPVLTDVHDPAQCGPVAEVCDVLQIPAFLCRQTDLIVAAARTGRALNIKKGQFMAPDDMRWAVEKATKVGNGRITVTERGVSFGYKNLVVDMRSFTILRDLGIPVIFDVTHSLQLPGAGQGETAGERRFAEPLARAAVAAGAAGIFMEVHPDPDNAKSDRATQLSVPRAEALAVSLLEIHRTLQANVPLA
ncbi:MAG: 3-deoxy-8-phosphooctulonate synthase [Thermoanaerobaculia bacterium]|nr:3-deoxy-8-phosphooctulonate synthase [Thermoanaerobaculia bacterium]